VEPLSTIATQQRCSSPTLGSTRPLHSLIRIAIGKAKGLSLRQSRQGACPCPPTLQAWRRIKQVVRPSRRRHLFSQVPVSCLLASSGARHTPGLPQSCRWQCAGLPPLPTHRLDRWSRPPLGRSTGQPSGGGAIVASRRGASARLANDCPLQHHGGPGCTWSGGLLGGPWPQDHDILLEQRPSPAITTRACPQGPALAGLHGQSWQSTAMPRRRRLLLPITWGRSTRRTSAMGSRRWSTPSQAIAPAAGGGKTPPRLKTA